MIKLIAFDLVGVLAKEKDLILSEKEDYLEKLFGDNISNEDYINNALSIIDDKNEVIYLTKEVINKLYEVKNIDVLEKIKKEYPNVKLIIATNHVTFVRGYIENNFDIVDDIIISAEINKIKPNSDFYNYILEKYNIRPEEMLFIDDSSINIEGATSIGVKALKVDHNTDILESVVQVFNKE